MGSPAAITSIFNLPPLDLNKLEEYEEQNQVRLNILKIVRRRHHSKTEVRAQKHYSTPGCQNNSNPKLDVAVDNWPSQDLYWVPCASLVDNQMACTVTESCMINFETPAQLARHEQTCTDKTTVNGKQKMYGTAETKLDQIVDAGYLPESFRSYRNTTLGTFDAETCQVGDAVKTISLAVGSTLDAVHYFERESSVAEDYQKLMDKFMQYLVQLLDKVEVPEEIQDAIERMDEELKIMERSPKKSKIQTFRNHLRKYEQLHVFGFNSSRFDLP